MISTKEQESLLVEISRKLTKKINVFAIGGTAMMFLGYKDTTLDIDLVFMKENDRKEFISAARSLGYEYMDPCRVYGTKENQPIMLKRTGDRLDLFLKKVISFTFSDNMKERTMQTHEFEENLIVKVADLHDIIIMKCATERAKDRDDIRNIILNSKIDWNIFLEEAKNQIELGNIRSVFFLFDTLLYLKDKMKVKIPEFVFKKLWSLIPYKK